MQKLMKSWVFTLIVCILLAMFAVLMFLSGFKVGGLHIGKSILHLIVAVGLAIYAIFTLCPMVVRCRGILQIFVFGELVILLLTAVAHVLVNYGIEIPLLAGLEVCSVVGLALWLRGAVETVHAYLSNAAERSEERVPLWRLLCYILLCAVGVWQLVKPLIRDDVFIFLIGAAAALCAALFGYFTAMNRKATAEVRRAKKAERRRIRDEKRAERERKEAEARRLAEEQKKAMELAAASVQIVPAPEAAKVEEAAAPTVPAEDAAPVETPAPTAQKEEEKAKAEEASAANEAPEAPAAKAEEKAGEDNSEDAAAAQESKAQEKPRTTQKKTGTAKSATTKKTTSGARSTGAKKSTEPRKASTVKKAAQAMEAKLSTEATQSDESAQ